MVGMILRILNSELVYYNSTKSVPVIIPILQRKRPRGRESRHLFKASGQVVMGLGFKAQQGIWELRTMRSCVRAPLQQEG